MGDKAMKRLTEFGLLSRMEAANRMVPKGHAIQHVRSRAFYMVRGHSLRSSDLEMMVHYVPQSVDGGVMFSRSAVEIQEKFVRVSGEPWDPSGQPEGGE